MLNFNTENQNEVKCYSKYTYNKCFVEGQL